MRVYILNRLLVNLPVFTHAALLTLVTSRRDMQRPPHRLSLSSFWREDPVGWFQYAEVEFIVANAQLNNYLCYSHVLRALSPEVIDTVRDYVRTFTPDKLDAYSTLKNVLNTRFSLTQVHSCFISLANTISYYQASHSHNRSAHFIPCLPPFAKAVVRSGKNFL